MAQVTRDAQLLARIDRYLTYLLDEWEGVPLLAREWDEWDAHSQLSLILDWPIREDKLYQLQGWAERDLLTPAQRERYAALLQLVARHRPTIEDLFAD